MHREPLGQEDKKSTVQHVTVEKLSALCSLFLS